VRRMDRSMDGSLNPLFSQALYCGGRLGHVHLRYAPSDFSTYCQVCLRDPRSRALHPRPPTPPRYKTREKSGLARSLRVMGRGIAADVRNSSPPLSSDHFVGRASCARYIEGLFNSQFSIVTGKCLSQGFLKRREVE
jgi:hypothetical protein